MKKIVNNRFPKNPLDLLKFSDLVFKQKDDKDLRNSVTVIFIGSQEAYKNFPLVYKTLLEICNENNINIKLKTTFQKVSESDFSDHFNTNLEIEWLKPKNRKKF